MIESIKKVNNPLTIIAIFAALAEVMGVVAIKLVNPEQHYIFIWFVMGFPVLLVTFFFLTLNFNHKALYAPSDYKEDESFLQTLNVNQLSKGLEIVQKQLEEAKSSILNDVTNQITTAGESERQKLSEIVNKQLNYVQEKVEETQNEVEHYLPASMNVKTDIIATAYQKLILVELRRNKKGLSKLQLENKLGFNPGIISRELGNLIMSGKVKQRKEDKMVLFFLPEIDETN